MSAGNEREFIDHLQEKETEVRRCCRTCIHYYREDIYNIEHHRCDEGGYTEIGDPDKKLTKEDCNAWERR